LRGDLGGEFERGVEHLLVGHDPIDETDALGLGGGDDPAGVDQLARLAEPDEARQTVGSAGRRDDAERDLRLAELRALTGDAQVAGDRQLAAPTRQKPRIAAITGVGNSSTFVNSDELIAASASRA
jgi:hypothetical protein